MTYKLCETLQAVDDVARFTTYLMDTFKNRNAALDFLDNYDHQIASLKTFPFDYRGVTFEYRGYEIRLKPYDTYNIFFIVDTVDEEIIVLRVLKDRQDWKVVLQNQREYRFV